MLGWLSCSVAGFASFSRCLDRWFVMAGWLAKYASWFGGLNGLAVLAGMAGRLDDWLEMLPSWLGLLAGWPGVLAA
jgi:hypothetical protein